MRILGLLILLCLVNISFVEGQEPDQREEDNIRQLLDKYFKAVSPNELSKLLIQPDKKTTGISKLRNQTSDPSSLGTFCINSYLESPQVDNIKIEGDRAAVIIRNSLNKQGTTIFRSYQYLRNLTLIKHNGEWGIAGVLIPLMQDINRREIDPCDLFEVAAVEKQVAQTLAIGKFNQLLDETKNFACSQSNSNYCSYYQSFEPSFAKMNTLRNVEVSDFTAWRLEANADFLREYRQTNDPAYLKAALEDSKNLLESFRIKPNPYAPGPGEKQIFDVIVTLSDGRFNGYEVKWTLTSWASTVSREELQKKGKIRTFDKDSKQKNFFAESSFNNDITVWSQEIKTQKRSGDISFIVDRNPIVKEINIP